MPEFPVSPGAPLGKPASSLPPPIRDEDPVSGQVLATRPRRARVSAIDPRRPVSQPCPSTRVNNPSSGRGRAIGSCRRAPQPRPTIQVDNPAASFPVSDSCTANKEQQEADNEIQRLNELRLGDDISYEEYSIYLKQLPHKPDLDTSTELDDVQLKELCARHALYRSKYYQFSQQVPKHKIYYDTLEGYHCRDRLQERFYKCYEEDDGLDWYFHPDYCKLAGLEDYQRLVPRNYGGYEYVRWDEYRRYCHSYEVEQEYIKYCEELSKKLKWIEAYVPNKYPSLKWGISLTRGTYQAIKIATDFSTISGGLAFSGFYEWVDSMRFDVWCCNELDGVYYEIWQRYTNKKKFRDALEEVYKLDRFPLRQDRMRAALEDDTFCSDLEEEFLACTTCLKEFAEDKFQITEEKARELIAEALRKEEQKPKFYEDYCRKKIDIARAIGLI